MAYFIDGVSCTKEDFEARIPRIKQHAKEVQAYVEQISSGEITLEDVPETHREEVEAIINAPVAEEPANSYGISDETYNTIIDDYTMSLMESGVL